MPGLHPHLAARRSFSISAGAAGGLHQQGEQPLGRAEVAAEQGAIGVDRGNQGDAAEVVPLGDHLRADKDVHLARMHRVKLRFQRSLELGRVGIDAGHARARQGLGQLLFQLLGAAAQGRDVRVAAARAGGRHPLGEAAVVAAQRAVQLVEDAEGAAVRAFALPAAFQAVQDRRIAAPVQEHQALLAPLKTLAQRFDQRLAQGRGNALVARQAVHVEQAHFG